MALAPALSVVSDADMLEFRALVVELAMPDSYQVQRVIGNAVDDMGNPLPDAIEATVEAGVCSLRAVNQQGGERVIADRLGWETAYAIDLDERTIVTPADRIIVNGNRTFAVGEVIHEGHWSVNAAAIVQERG